MQTELSQSTNLITEDKILKLLLITLKEMLSKQIAWGSITDAINIYFKISSIFLADLGLIHYG